MRSRLIPAVVTVVILLAAAPVRGANAPKQHAVTGVPVPYGFVGVDVDGPVLAPDAHVDLAHQLDVMVSSGVDSIRVAFSWAGAQPYRSWADVPAADVKEFTDVGGVPTDFAATDQIVGLAALRGITVLPTVLYTPGWDAGSNPHGFAPPANTAPYAAFLKALIHRYGPRGSFWAARHGPRRPIRMWQIWNEPNLPFYWRQPFAASYVKLLKAAHDAIKQADGGATVVLAALTNFAWDALRQIHRVPGAGRLFDVISVNGFTATPASVMLFLRFMRRAADALGDRAKPILATEVSWVSAKGKSPQHFDWSTTEARQAQNIRALLPLLAAGRASLNLLGFDWYTWAGEESRGAPAFSFAGLFRFSSGGRFVAKPAYSAFRRGALAIEGCRAKHHLATNCSR